jgi:hypothetical protein
VCLQEAGGRALTRLLFIQSILLFNKNSRGDRYEQILLVAGLGFASLKLFTCLHLFALKTFDVTVARGQKKERNVNTTNERKLNHS